MSDMSRSQESGQYEEDETEDEIDYDHMGRPIPFVNDTDVFDTVAEREAAYADREEARNGN